MDEDDEVVEESVDRSNNEQSNEISLVIGFGCHKQLGCVQRRG